MEHDAPRDFRVNSFRGTIHPYDANVLLSRPPWVFTSPNLTSIQYVEVDPSPLFARADGRFGFEDYAIWPQSYTESYPWAPCVLRKPAPSELSNHPLWILWENPQKEDWVAPPGACWQKTGVLRDSFHAFLRQEVQPIIWRALEATRRETLPPYVVVAVNALTATLARLRDLPMSFRDLVLQVTQAQRMCLDLLAMEEYHTQSFARMMQRDRVYPLRSELMGCFTNNPTTVENMFYAGIPVVYVRPYRLTLPSQVRVRSVTLKFDESPSDVVTASWPGNSCKILHDGASGTRRFQMSRPCGRYFEDLAALPDVHEDTVNMAPFLEADPIANSSSHRLGNDQDDEPADEHWQSRQSLSPPPSQSDSLPLITHPYAVVNRKIHEGGVSKQVLQPNSRKAKKLEASKRNFYIIRWVTRIFSLCALQNDLGEEPNQT